MTVYLVYLESYTGGMIDAFYTDLMVVCATPETVEHWCNAHPITGLERCQGMRPTKYVIKEMEVLQT
jgi:hypothetical protein